MLLSERVVKQKILVAVDFGKCKGSRNNDIRYSLIVY